MIMDWLLVVFFSILILTIRFIMLCKPMCVWEKEERTFYLWYDSYNKCGYKHRDWLIKFKIK